MFSTLLLLLLTATSGIKCIELVQPAVMLVKPGESFSVPCKITGYSATSSCTNWIQHLSGQALEWIRWYCSSSNTGSRDSLKNEISFSAESSSNTVTLHGQNFQTEDTAVYYCARETQSFRLLVQLYKIQDVHGEELTQPASMTVQPGQSLSIHCKVSYSVTSYGTAWIRQPAGKALEWVSLMGYDGKTYYSEKLKSRVQVSRDTSSNTVTLTGQNMQTEDTAVYYCARDTQ
ncbi:hypothetical protein QTP70_014178 [Hemibagrus guttatus]|uniref:Ig-like domain-containing protein n=1 Tax=Hemibagrus guttatus TaxID=175788 RepID=A0AAE0UUP2_9TELE|nr:hypothetical protein QTP70_014178 [Hemibagrus guttatus]